MAEIRIEDVPEDTKEYLETFKDDVGLTWKGMLRLLEGLLKHLVGDISENGET